MKWNGISEVGDDLERCASTSAWGAAGGILGGGREQQGWSQASPMPDSSGGAEEQGWPGTCGKAAHHSSSSSHGKLATKIFA